MPFSGLGGGRTYAGAYNYTRRPGARKDRTYDRSVARSIPADLWEMYATARLAGSTRKEACIRLGIAPGSATRFDRGDVGSSGHKVWIMRCQGRYPFAVEAADAGNGSPTLFQQRALAEVQCNTSEARQALTDFDLFRRRYLGEISRPWMIAADEAVDRGMQEPGRSFIIINVAPGTGKSTLIRAKALQLTCRNRALRGARLSSVLALGRSEVRLIRRHLERTTPVRQREDLIQRGLACDAVATLEADYGRFKPEGRDLWSADQFVVLQPGGEQIAEKEPTWSAYGMDSAIIGFRFEVMLADDIDTPSAIRASEEVRRQRENDWKDEIETRQEPDGLIVVLGQRLAKKDIYRFLLDMKISTDDGEVLDLRRNPDGHKYTQIVFPAHDDAACTSLHNRDAPALGEGGCLLDPYRQPWRDLLTTRNNNPETYATVMQQKDGTGTTDLVDIAWIDGGTDKEGNTYPTGNCRDTDRRLWEIPMMHRRYGIGCITVDPSGVNHWAVQAWCFVPPATVDDEVVSLDTRARQTLGHQRILLDLFDGEMPANDLIDWKHEQQLFVGRLEEWRQNYLTAGIRLRYVIVEVNVMQRYLLQFDHATRWARQHEITFIPHTTGVLKTDEKLGVYCLKAPYRFGLVRLPSGDPISRAACAPLIQQVTNFPGRRTDQVMSQWFGERNLSKMHHPNESDGQERQWRPSWLNGAADPRVMPWMIAPAGAR